MPIATTQTDDNGGSKQLLDRCIELAGAWAEADDAQGNHAKLQSFLQLGLAATLALEQRHARGEFLRSAREAFELPLETERSSKRSRHRANFLPLDGSVEHEAWLELWSLTVASPESSGRTQWSREPSAPGDLWALGCLLFGALNRMSPPFEASREREGSGGGLELSLLHAKLTTVPPSLASIHPGRLPMVLAEIIAKLIRCSPDARYASARSLREDLEECVRRLRPTTEGAPVALGDGLGPRAAIERFTIGGGGPRPAAEPLPSALHGRSRALSDLQRALAPALAPAPGSAPSACLVSIRGAAGEGKTALVAEFARRCAAEGAARGRASSLILAAGKHDQFCRSRPYAAVAAAARDLAAQALAGQAALAVPIAHVRTLFDASGPLAPARVPLCGLLPDLIFLLNEDANRSPSPSVPSPDAVAEVALPASGSAAAALVSRAFEEIFRAFASVPGCALLLFVDDLQWGDEESLALLRRLAASASASGESPAPVALVVAHRPPSPGEEGADVPSFLHAVASSGCPVAEVPVGPLSVGDVSSLLTDALRLRGAGGDAAGAAGPVAVARLASTLHRATLGNPLALAQVLQHLHRAGLLRRDASGVFSWEAAAVEAGVPHTPDAADLLLRSALPSLSEPTRRALAVAAILGHRFSRRLLVAACASTLAGAGEVDAALAEALAASLLRPVTDRSFAFLHDRVQQAALLMAEEPAALRFAVGRRLATLPRAHSARISRAEEAQEREEETSAMFLAAELLAAGYTAGLAGGFGDALCVAETCLAAGKHSLAAGANAAAAPLLASGVAALEPFASLAAAAAEADPAAPSAKRLKRGPPPSEGAPSEGRGSPSLEDPASSPAAARRAAKALSELRLALARCQALTGSASTALETLAGAEALVGTRLEKLRLLRVRSLCFSALGDARKGVELGFAALVLCGAPAEDARHSPRAALAAVLASQPPGAPHSLLELPCRADPELMALHETAATTLASLAALGESDLAAALVCAVLSHSIPRGNAPTSPLWYAAFGSHCISFMLGEHAAASAWGAVARAAAARFSSGPRITAWVHLLSAGGMPAPGEDYGTTCELVERALEFGRDAFEAPVVALAALVKPWLLFIRGRPLAALAAAAADVAGDAAKGDGRVALEGLAALAGALARPPPRDTTSDSDDPGEAAREPPGSRWDAALAGVPLFAQPYPPPGMHPVCAGIGLCLRLFAAVLAGHGGSASAREDLAALNAIEARGCPFVHEAAFLSAAVRLLRAADAGGRRAEAAELEAAAHDEGAAAALAAACPAEFGPRHAVAAASAAFLRGADLEALEGLAAAHEAARAHGGALVAAVASLLGARAAEAAGRPALARMHAAAAAECLLRTGAEAKAAELGAVRTLAPRCRSPPASATAAPSTQGGSWLAPRPGAAPRSIGSVAKEERRRQRRQRALDVQTIVEAMHALNDEAARGGLGGRVLSLLMENAGAKRGLLLLRRDASDSPVAAAFGVGADRQRAGSVSSVGSGLRVKVEAAIEQAAESTFDGGPESRSGTPREGRPSTHSQRPSVEQAPSSSGRSWPPRAPEAAAPSEASGASASCGSGRRAGSSVVAPIVVRPLDAPLDKFDDAAAEIIRYVERTGRCVVLADAAAEGAFTADPYVASHGSPLSVLCVPLLRQLSLEGVVYLENASLAGAFTADRVDLVRLLGAQLAIALQSARMFEVQARSCELHAQNAALAKLDQAKDALLANTSHEMRTPIGAIAGMISLLLETPLDDQQREMATIVQQSADHLLSVIGAFLDLAALENGRITLADEDFDLFAAVEEATGTVTSQAARNGVQLRSFVEPTAPLAVRGDAARLKQVLINLAANAVKFFDGEKPPEERRVSIEVAPVREADAAAAAAAAGLPPSAAAEQLYLDCAIADTGPGMRREDVSRLFTRFTQLESGSRKAQGSGLGLAISKSLVQEMRGRCEALAERLGAGRIDVESELGKGTRFRFRVAVGRAAAGPATHEDPLRLACGGRPARVALLARGPSLAAAERVLLAYGHEAAAHGPGGAAAALAAGGADAVLVDAALAGGDVPALVALLREAAGAGPAPAPPAVLVLARAGDPLDRELVSRSFACALFKPLGQRKLLQALANCLGPSQGAPARLSLTAPSPPPRPVSAGPPAALLASRRVLVVEDNPVNQILARKLLEQGGYGVEVASDGLEAVEAVRRESPAGGADLALPPPRPYAAILMDCQMPRCDGFEATALIRREDADLRRVPLPIIAMTANAFSRDREQCFAAGMNAFLTKPVKKGELLAAIDGWAQRPVPSAPAAEAGGDRAAAAAAAVARTAGIVERARQASAAASSASASISIPASSTARTSHMSSSLSASSAPAAPVRRSVPDSLASLAAAVAGAGEPPATSPSRAPAGGPPPLILLAESDDGSREFMRTTLISLGYRVVAVAAGARGVPDAMREAATDPTAAGGGAHPFDLVLLDADDLEASCVAAGHIRRQEAAAGRRRHAPVLATSAFPLAEERAACIEAGVTDYLPKPARKRDVLWLLCQWLPMPAARP